MPDPVALPNTQTNPSATTSQTTQEAPTTEKPATPLVPSTPDPAKTEAKAPASLLNEEAEKKDAPVGAPEKYEDFKVPEGFEVKEDAVALLKDLNLPQESAQKAIDFFVTKLQEASQGPVDFWNAKQEEWKNEIKADKEIGGKLDVVKATVSKALDAVCGPALATEFKAMMDYTGAGNSPAFVKAFYKMALALTEGTPVIGNKPGPAGQTPSGKPTTAAAAMYPNLPSGA